MTTPAVTTPARAEAGGAVVAARLPQVTQHVAAILAPTTFLTSLLIYFGWMHAYWFFDYFGVHSTILGLGTTDYVMRSADALFVPLTVLAGGSLAALWAYVVLRPRLALRFRPLLVRRITWVIAAVGGILTFGGTLTVFRPTVLDRQVALAPLCLAAGVLLLFIAVRLGRARRAPTGRRDAPRESPQWTSIIEWSAVLLVVALSMFWAATDYSAAVGRTQARKYVDQLDRQPDVLIYSARSLRLSAPGVREIRCQDPEAAYQFRYDGLKLMIQSGGQYVFVPVRWSRPTGTAFVIPSTDALRLDFLPVGATPPPGHC